VIAAMQLLVVAAVSPLFAGDGALSSGVIEEIQSTFKMDAHSRAIYNSITNKDIRDLALNREIVRNHDKLFSHKVDVKGITNQKSSGRCWLFAGLNSLRYAVIEKHKLDDFEFSQIYFTFWDKLEKSNTFLEYIIDFRERDLLDREMEFILKLPCGDGGFWESVVDLIEKYGAVPKDVMPETSSSNKTRSMNAVLNQKLRADAVKLRKMHSRGKSVKQLRKEKEKMLAEVYRILALNLGEPPTEFTWRYEDKNADDDADDEDDDADEDDDDDADGDEDADEDHDDDADGDEDADEDHDDDADGDEDADDDHDDDADGDDDDADEDKDKDKDKEPVIRRISTTPQCFWEEFVGIDLDEYVNIFNDTTHDYGKHYRVKMSRNLYDGHDIHYVNIDIEMLREIAIKVVLDDTPLMFACDVSDDQNSNIGIMAIDLYDYDSIYGIDMDMSKAERALYRNSVRNHGMVLVGIDIQDDKPVKWRVENSWGSDKGQKGYWTLYDSWFDLHVYNIIVKKKYVPQEILEIYEQPAIVLPAWDPMMKVLE
jgi:bleomycin hydrolase